MSAAAQLGASCPLSGCAASPVGAPCRGRPQPGGCSRALAEPRAVGVGAPSAAGESGLHLAPADADGTGRAATARLGGSGAPRGLSQDPGAVRACRAEPGAVGCPVLPGLGPRLLCVPGSKFTSRRQLGCPPGWRGARGLPHSLPAPGHHPVGSAAVALPVASGSGSCCAGAAFAGLEAECPECSWQEKVAATPLGTPAPGPSPGEAEVVWKRCGEAQQHVPEPSVLLVGIQMASAVSSTVPLCPARVADVPSGPRKNPLMFAVAFTVRRGKAEQCPGGCEAPEKQPLPWQERRELLRVLLAGSEQVLAHRRAPALPWGGIAVDFLPCCGSSWQRGSWGGSAILPAPYFWLQELG